APTRPSWSCARPPRSFHASDCALSSPLGKILPVRAGALSGGTVGNGPSTTLSRSDTRENAVNMPRNQRIAEDGAAAEGTPTLKDLDPSERPRERLLDRGPEALSSAELLAIILRTGVAGLMVTDLARGLLVEYGGIGGLARVSAPELARRHGLGPAKAAQLKAALEIGRRLVLEETAVRDKISSPEDLARLVQLEMSALEQEQLRVFL